MRPSSQRWYDGHKTLSDSVRLLETFPDEIQNVLGDVMVRLANRQSEADDLMADLKSLGPEKVLGIFKSKNKRRSHDANSAVHQALNYMYLLPEEGRLMVAEHVIRLVNVIVDYLKICRLLRMPALPNEVAGIASAYMEGGTEKAMDYLHVVRPRPMFIEGEDEAPKTSAPEAQEPETRQEEEGGQRLMQDRRGLRIRQERE